MGFWKSITKKAVHEATEAVKEEVVEKASESMNGYLPLFMVCAAICAGLSVLTHKSSPSVAKRAPEVMVMLVDSRGIHRL